MTDFEVCGPWRYLTTFRQTNRLIVDICRRHQRMSRNLLDHIHQRSLGGASNGLYLLLRQHTHRMRSSVGPMLISTGPVPQIVIKIDHGIRRGFRRTPNIVHLGWGVYGSRMIILYRDQQGEALATGMRSSRGRYINPIYEAPIGILQYICFWAAF
jgi:hypothetical protein